MAVDGSFFQANLKMLRAARFTNCPGARFAGNVASNFHDDGKNPPYVAIFEPDCAGVVEYGNRDINILPAGDPPRIRFWGPPGLSLSKGVVQVQQYASLPATTGITPGSIIWVEADRHLYVLVSSSLGWKKIKFSDE